MYKQWKYTKKRWFFSKKKNTMKACFKAIILSIKIYKNILKFNFLMEGGMGVLDILTADAMKCVIFMGTKKNFEWTLI